ncbi:MAG: D-aminoacylase [Alphaproteobacteria bacterium]|nr:D-aminoacylase [Alphaproteobacteria bacterium]
MFDVLIKGGTIVDGSGRPRFTGDVAIANGTIVEVGKISGAARETVSADGLLVTPGWVDIHTHYDGQVTWDPLLTPSIWHGVTTLVMGNCGVGFAPAAPDRRDWVIGLMEGVEAIPGAALAAGIRWSWESFAEYLDAVAATPRALDVAAQIAHGPVRAYVMGDRAGEPATADEVARQCTIVRQAFAAGAVGFSTSRSLLHLDVNGEYVPGTFAGEGELEELARTVVASGHGLFELTVRGMTGFDEGGPPEEITWMRRVALKTGCPFTFLLGQTHDYPTVWRDVLRSCESAALEGARIYPQVFGRPTNFLFTFQGLNPFSRHPSFKELERLPWPERLRRLRDPQTRARILADHDPNDDAFHNIMKRCWGGTYELGEPLDYEPDPVNSVATRARRQGIDPAALGYDLLLGEDGTAVLYFTAFNYADGDMETIRELLVHPLAVLGGGDGGAHVAYICDASVPTFMLTHWVRDRARGARLPLEWVVRKQAFDNACLYGFFDRGLVRPGMKADLNLIDFDALRLAKPYFANDLPAGALRLNQGAAGYVATYVAGEVVQRDGQETGARPGRLVRGGA